MKPKFSPDILLQAALQGCQPGVLLLFVSLFVFSPIFADVVIYQTEFPDELTWERGSIWMATSNSYRFDKWASHNCDASCPDKNTDEFFADSVWSTDFLVPVNVDSIFVSVENSYDFNGYVWNYGYSGYSRSLFSDGVELWQQGETSSTTGYWSSSGSDPITVGFSAEPLQSFNIAFLAAVQGDSYGSWEAYGHLVWNLYSITITGIEPENLKRTTWAGIKAICSE